MTASAARWRRQVRPVVVGAVIGTLLAATTAFASHITDAHTYALWYHGERTEGNEDAHPFLYSTDGTARNASAAYLTCPGYGNIHSTNAEYIGTHVHKWSDYHWLIVEAHLGSDQTSLSHHAHGQC